MIDLDEIQRRTEPVAQGMQYGVMVFGRDGIILAEHPEDASRLGTRLPSDHPLMPNVNMQIEGVTTGREADGSERIFAFSQLPQTGAKVVVELARADALGDADKAISGMLIALAIVAMLAAGGAWLTAELSVLRWVAVLRNAAFAFARRDLDHRADRAETRRRIRDTRQSLQRHGRDRRHAPARARAPRRRAYRGPD